MNAGISGRLFTYHCCIFLVGNKISSPIVLEHFVVMEDYKKQAKSDINLKKGKTVDVIEKRECGKIITIILFLSNLKVAEVSSK